jgi:VanZ family protein
VNSVLHGLKHSRFAWYWLPALSYCLIIFGLSALPKTISVPSPYAVDKVLHIMEYGVLGFLLARSLVNSRAGVSKRALIILVVGLATSYGISDEIHQAFVPGRNASAWDVVADGLGGVMGALIYTRFVRDREKRVTGKKG